MKYQRYPETVCCVGSPSMRREWIEMSIRHRKSVSKESPSMRREWIEMILIPEC